MLLVVQQKWYPPIQGPAATIPKHQEFTIGDRPNLQQQQQITIIIFFIFPSFPSGATFIHYFCEMHTYVKYQKNHVLQLVSILAKMCSNSIYSLIAVH